MKKWVWILTAALLLTGCAAKETMETVADVYEELPDSPAAQMVCELPEDAVVSAMEVDGKGELYFCDGYTVTLQTLHAGDLDATLREVTGFSREKLTVMETTQDGGKRYDCVWSCAGEGGDQVGRAAILDDGSYHYVLAVMAPEENAGALTDTWQALLDSFRLG